MMTVCAGRLTPQASVAVQQSTLISPAMNSCSARLRSLRSMPAWWMPMPMPTSSRSSWFLLLPSCRSSESTWPERLRLGGPLPALIASISGGSPRSARASSMARSTSLGTVLRKDPSASADANSRSAAPDLAARDAISMPVRPVSLRECTKTMTCFSRSIASTHLSKASSVMRSRRRHALRSATPKNVCARGTGRKSGPKWKSPVSGLTRRKRPTSW
mmetsp:Transcript_18092/g.68344  ORF Transcript_18092/g.68344 Transcript_18092/m.68344 type:complete len:217 (-) Transcript_18092:343-993(-)